MAKRKLLKSKIHRAIITDADLEYEGSLTIPPELMEAANIIEYEAVSVWNVERGTRFETYAITGEPGSTTICANGACAHLNEPGDRVIIATFAWLTEEETEKHQPKLVFIDENNGQFNARTEVAGPSTLTTEAA